METAQIHVEIDDISRLMSLNLHYEALPLSPKGLSTVYDRVRLCFSKCIFSLHIQKCERLSVMQRQAGVVEILVQKSESAPTL